MQIGEFLTATQLDTPGRKTQVWRIFGVHGDLLGQVQWFGRWRQYTFSPANETTFNRGCMTDLVVFLDKLNAAQREKRQGLAKTG